MNIMIKGLVGVYRNPKFQDSNSKTKGRIGYMTFKFDIWSLRLEAHEFIRIGL
jgi:hypothetical protein